MGGPKGVRPPGGEWQTSAIHQPPQTGEAKGASPAAQGALGAVKVPGQERISLKDKAISTLKGLGGKVGTSIKHLANKTFFSEKFDTTRLATADKARNEVFRLNAKHPDTSTVLKEAVAAVRKTDNPEVKEAIGKAISQSTNLTKLTSQEDIENYVVAGGEVKEGDITKLAQSYEKISDPDTSKQTQRRTRFAQALLLDGKGKLKPTALNLVKERFSAQIKHEKAEGLFRGDSLTTALYREFVKAAGNQWIKEQVLPQNLIGQIEAGKSDFKAIAQQVLKNINESIDQNTFPKEILQASKDIAGIVSAHKAANPNSLKTDATQPFKPTEETALNTIHFNVLILRVIAPALFNLGTANGTKASVALQGLLKATGQDPLVGQIAGKLR